MNVRKLEFEIGRIEFTLAWDMLLAAPLKLTLETLDIASRSARSWFVGLPLFFVLIQSSLAYKYKIVIFFFYNFIFFCSFYKILLIKFKFNIYKNKKLINLHQMVSSGTIYFKQFIHKKVKTKLYFI